jgi:hypothetical protein
LTAAMLQHQQLPGLEPQGRSVAALLLLLLSWRCCLLLVVLQKRLM